MKEMFEMKKILSVTLTLAFVLSMCVFVFATDITMTDGDAAAAALGGANGLSLTTADGSNGKAASDKVMRLTKQDVDKDEFIYPTGTFDEITADYYVIEFNYMPKVDAHLAIKTNKGSAFASTITQNHVFNNQWNKVLIYVDYTELKAGTKTTVKSYLFVNGSGYNGTDGYSNDDPDNNFGKPNNTTGAIRSFRFAFVDKSGATAENITTVTADIDDLKMYSTDTKPSGEALTSFTPITEGKLSVSGKVATVENGTTLADLKAEYPTYQFVAYTDANKTTEIGDAVPLTKNHTLAIEDANNVISCCTVLIDGLVTMTEGKASEAGLNVTRLTSAAVDGTMGKAASDKVLQFAHNGTNNDGYMWGNGLTPVGSDTKVAKNYFVIKFNYMPKNNTGLAFRTANNAAFATPMNASCFNQDKWNSVLVYLDYTQIDDDFDYSTITNPDAIPAEAKLSVCPIGRVYINGTRFAGDLTAGRLRDRYGMYNTISGSSQTGSANVDLRIAPLYSALEATEIVAKMDDFSMYITNVEPNGKAETAMPTAITSDSSFAQVGENLVTVKNGAALSLLTADAGTVTIVTDDTGTAAADFDNAKYVFVTSGDKYKAYDISVFDKTVNGDDVSVTATNVVAGSTIFVAEYGADGNLVDVAFGGADALNNITVSYAAKNAANTIKAFLLENTTSIRPLIGSITVK